MELMRHSDTEFFLKSLSELGIELSELQLEQFLIYYEMLTEKNKVMNLTAITEYKEVISKHFVDSLTLARIYKLTNEKVIDLGTGAGFPGIPLKIVYPDIELILFDSLKKRLNFLDEVIEKLNLPKTSTLHGRAEDYGRDIKYREKYDLCVSRAVARLPVLLEFCTPFVKKGGYFISYKSGNIDEEINASQNALNKLKTEISSKDTFILPGTDMQRTLLLLKKLDNTPKQYPRSPVKIEKSPL